MSFKLLFFVNVFLKIILCFRLKCVEITLSALDEATNVVSELELKLSAFGDMPSELQPLQNVSN